MHGPDYIAGQRNMPSGTRVKGDEGEGVRHWSDYMPPNWQSGRRGARWGIALKAARRHGAVIVVEDSGEAVEPTPKGSYRPWVGIDSGYRYASQECVPVW